MRPKAGGLAGFVALQRGANYDIAPVPRGILAGSVDMALIRIQKNPPPRTLRLFAGVWFPLFLGLLGYKVWRTTGSLEAAAAVWIPTATIAMACLAWMPLARALFVGLSIAVFPIGWVLSNVIMLIVFYGVLTPVALLMRLLRYDPMKRRIDRAAKSYWIARESTIPLHRYFRQY
jgi:hypothetical protein